jgi:hypothetical protein
MKRLVVLLVIALLAVSGLNLTTAPAAVRQAPANAAAPLTQDLLQFTSQGQLLGFQPGGIYIASPTHALHVSFVDAKPVQPGATAGPAPQIETTSPGEPGGKPGGAAPLGAVVWSNLWDGIALTAGAAQGSIYETTYTLAPGAQVSRIRLSYNVPARLEMDGSLSIPVADGTLRESAPIAWQEVGGERKPVSAAFDVSPVPGGAQVGFSLGVYDPRLAVTIDPRMEWAVRMGSGSSTAYDIGSALAIDGSGNLFIGGNSYLPWSITGVSTKRAFTQRASGYGIDAFVVKLNSSGAAQWLTFLGGADDDTLGDLALDGSGAIYVCGASYASWGSPAVGYHAASDVFVAKLNSDGSLNRNTFMGSLSNDYGVGLAFGNGSLYLGGTSQDSWGSPVRPFSMNGINTDGFVAQLDPTNLGVNWNTFLGGTGSDSLRKIVVDSTGNVAAAGSSNATWGSSPLRLFSGADAFVARVDGSGNLLWNTFLGGAGSDDAQDIALEPASGSLYVIGSSDQTWNIVTLSSPASPYTGSNDSFVVALTYAGTPLWYTFLGSAGGFDVGAGVTVSNNTVFVTGYSNATWGSPLHAYTGSYDAYVAALSQQLGVLQWNTFYGGMAIDQGNAILVDNSNASNLGVYVVGQSASDWGAPIRDYSGNYDSMVMKISGGSGWSLQWNSFFGAGQDDVANALVLDPATGNLYVTGTANSSWNDYARRKYTWLDDAFVEAFNDAGQRLWVTYLGGSGADAGNSIVFAANKLYVAGESNATWGGPIDAYAGSTDVFVALLDPASGDLQWNTFRGGSGIDILTGLTVSSLGQIFAGGYSNATWGGPSEPYTAGYDGFMFMLDADGSRLWNTFLGGNGNDEVYDVHIHGNTLLYAVGASTASWGYPIVDTFQGGSSDAFIARIDPNTGRYDVTGWVSFLGGTGSDAAYSVATNAFGYPYVAGVSSASWGTPRRSYTLGNDAFAAYLSSAGYIQWNTFLGGAGNDRGVAITIDPSGNPFVTGSSDASWGTPLVGFHGNTDLFISRLTWDGYLVWNVFQGGAGADIASGIAATGDLASGTERIYTSSSTDTPWLPNAFSWSKDGTDGVLASLNPRYFVLLPSARK